MAVRKTFQNTWIATSTQETFGAPRGDAHSSSWRATKLHGHLENTLDHHTPMGLVMTAFSLVKMNPNYK